MPAFLERAVLELGDVGSTDSGLRPQLSRVCGVRVPPATPNPFQLPISENPLEWGTGSRSASAAFENVQAVLGARRLLTLELYRLDEVAFGLYEDLILEQTARGGIVGIGLDYREFVDAPQPAGPGTTRHLARLTPCGDETQNEPNIRSSAFKLDYQGMIHVFDDTGEMPAHVPLAWPRLLRAARLSGGEFWTVAPRESGT